jgi:hypothetical protein
LIEEKIGEELEEMRKLKTEEVNATQWSDIL